VLKSSDSEYRRHTTQKC